VGRRNDLIGIIESAYQVDLAVEAWLRAIVASTGSALDAHIGVFGVLYDVRGSRVRIRAAADTADGTFAKAARSVMLANRGNQYVKDGLASHGCACALATETTGLERTPLFDTFRPLGVEDMVGINGVNSSGLGCFVGVLLPNRAPLRRTLRSSLARVSTHFAAGHRLMLRMREEPDAIFTARGRVEHATGDARQPGPLDSLREAVAAIEHARSTAGRSEPDEAVKRWRGLVSARWSLVEQFDTDGKRYILARANEPAPSIAGGLEMLTARERQIVAHLMLGHSMKLIAYELGIAYSTVRVLTMRACAKLGVNGREELLAATAKSSD
jgi:DNA-binding CsgD family transcriptional regulator